MRGYPKIDIPPPPVPRGRTREGTHGDFRWKVRIAQSRNGVRATIRVDVTHGGETVTRRAWHAVPGGVGKPRKRLWRESSRKAQDTVRNIIMAKESLTEEEQRR